MSIGMFIALLIGAATVGFVLRRLSSRHSSRRTLNRVSKLDFAEQKLKDNYFRAIRSGNFARRLVRVYSQMDMALILSILSAREIPCQTLFANTNQVRTGLGIQGYNDCYVVVLSTDYQRAKSVLLDYIKRRQAIGAVRPRTRFRNLAEVILFGWAANSTYLLPELIDARRNERLEIPTQHR